MEGQINLSDAINRTIDFVNEKGKAYTLNEKTAVLLVRPRGLHLPEKHIEINGERASGSLPILEFIFSEMQKTSGKWKWTLFLSPEIRTL
jgi:malate synthase